MEFRLNKIDTDIRRKLAEDVKDDKIHSKKDKPVENNVKGPFVKNEYRKRQDSNKLKKYLTIDGEKITDQKIVIEAESIEEINLNSSSGIFIDNFR